MPNFVEWRYQLSILIFVAVCIVLVLGVAHALPSYDLSVSSAFCTAVAALPGDVPQRACSGFPIASMSAFEALRKVLFYIPPLALVVLVIDIVRSGLFSTSTDPDRLRYKIHAIGAYLVGPILIANMILKSWSGRPRPYESLQFGGDLTFVPAGDFTGACTSNCSFISGEAAAAAWLLCLLPLVGMKYRRPATLIILAVSLSTPVLRVAMGGHYLSDAMLGWLLGAAAFPLVVVASAAIGHALGRSQHRPA